MNCLKYVGLLSFYQGILLVIVIKFTATNKGFYERLNYGYQLSYSTLDSPLKHLNHLSKYWLNEQALYRPIEY